MNAVVVSSSEGYRISIGEAPVLVYSNGIILAEQFANFLIEYKLLLRKIEGVKESLLAYESSGNNPQYESLFNGLKKDVWEAVSGPVMPF